MELPDLSSIKKVNSQHVDLRSVPCTSAAAAFPPELNHLQTWMQSVLINPEGTDAETLPTISDVLHPSSKQTSEERLQVYCNAYFARLLDCLRDEFSGLSQFLGQETFDGLAAAYLSEHPSRTHTLASLGAEFPRFLHDSRDKFGDLDTPNSDGPPPWTQFLIDLATLERVQSEVFDGPGTEGLSLLSPDELRQIPPDAWSETRLQVAPCLRLLALDYPVHDYLKAIRQDPEAPLPTPCPTWLAITRRQYMIRRIPLEQGEFQVLSGLAECATIGEALNSVAETRDDLEVLANDVGRWFQSWTIEGFFTAIG